MNRNLKPYQHTVQYYETDRMGITHHSNYIRWMEESRIDFMKQIGWEYAKLEELGIISPVLGLSCDYQASTTFSDVVLIDIKVLSFTGVRMELAYEMRKAAETDSLQTGDEQEIASADRSRSRFAAGKPVCRATSRHCFLDAGGRPVRLKRDYPELYECLMQYVAPKDGK